MFEHTKKLIDTFIQMGVPGGDLVVYQDGKEVLRYITGHQDLEKTIPLTGKERYHIYSCSKLITCTAALQLWEQGKFSLEDKLSDFMPEFAEMTVVTPDGEKKAENPILIENLFEMTAGMDYALRFPQMVEFLEKNPAAPTVETVKQLAKRPLRYEPGEGWLYSMAHDVLAALVEVWSGQNFEDYVQEHIFAPLGMENSTFLFPEERFGELCIQYKRNTETGQIRQTQENVYRFGPEYCSGGAGCVSTVEDYIKFCEGLRTGKLLKPETVKLMSTARLDEKQFSCYNKTAHHSYGLGVHTPKPGGYRTDFGWGGAAGAYTTIDLTCGVSLFYAQHMPGGPNMSDRWRITDAVMADLFGRPMEPWEPKIDWSYTLTY